MPPEWLHDEWLAITAVILGRIDAIEAPLIDYRQHGANVVGVARPSLPQKLRKVLSPRGQRSEGLVGRAAALLRWIESRPELPPEFFAEAQQKFLQVVDNQSTQVISLCESLLLQAKIEAGLFTLRPEKTDVAVIVRDVVAAMRSLCEQRSQRITLDTPQVMPRILADPMLLTQAMTNLLSNASRFTTTGGSIDVRVMVVDSGVAVYVTDDGAGMTRAERERLFQRFATGRPLVDGTGLGLVITKIIIELHGGEILVHTASTRGTTFLLTLPSAP
jgi:signal transduction histidine kinase